MWHPYCIWVNKDFGNIHPLPFASKGVTLLTLEFLHLTSSAQEVHKYMLQKFQYLLLPDLTLPSNKHICNILKIIYRRASARAKRGCVVYNPSEFGLKPSLVSMSHFLGFGRDVNFNMMVLMRLINASAQKTRKNPNNNKTKHGATFGHKTRGEYVDSVAEFAFTISPQRKGLLLWSFTRK